MAGRIIDVIERCRDRIDYDRGVGQLQGVMLHRCGLDLQTGVVLGYDGPSVSDAFTGRNPKWPDVAKATGNQNAYTFLLGSDLGPPEHDGVVWQCLALEEVGWHARRWSRGWVGVGWIADPRSAPLSVAAYAAAVDLVAALCAWGGWDPRRAVRGHGEVPGAHGGEKAPGLPAACPGLTQAQLDGFREDVAAHSARALVAELGVVLTDELHSLAALGSPLPDRDPEGSGSVRA